MSDRFANHVYEHLKAELEETAVSLKTWPDELPYMASLLVDNIDDDPARPTVRIAFEHPPEDPEDMPRWEANAESQWNYAALSQDDSLILGAVDADPVGQRLVAELLVGVPHDGQARQKCFVAELVVAVQQVHREQLTQQHLGKPVPLIIHELLYSEQIASRNVGANGLEIAQPFVTWLRDWCSAPKRDRFDAAMRDADRTFRTAMGSAG